MPDPPINASLAELDDICAEVERQLQGTVQRTLAARGALESFRSLIHSFPSSLADALQTRELELRQRSVNLETVLEETEARLVEKMETGRETMEELLAEQLDQVNGAVNGVVEGIQEQMEALFGRLKDLRGAAEDLGGELLGEALPEEVKKGGGNFISGMNSLKETGIGELKKISDSVGGIQERTRALTDLVDEVKPVLDLAQKIL